MRESTVLEQKQSRVTYNTLEVVVRGKVQGFIHDILEEEMAEFLGRDKSVRIRGIDILDRYRNGKGKPRRLALMGGTVTIKRPRLREMEGFESKILPLFTRRTKELGEMLPELYLHGLAQGDFELALRGLLGDGAPLSAASIQRLKAQWQVRYEAWKQEDLSKMEVVYQWADGIYVKAGLEKEKAAMLVVIGALSNGEKRVLACESGYQESKESWMGVLRDMMGRGLKLGRLTVADGHFGIWSALSELHPQGGEQRCWNHKIRNVLDAMPKRIRAEAAEYLCKIPYAQTKQQCRMLRDIFTARYRKEYPKAVEKLLSDWDRMETFYAYPKEHWVHIRTTNVVESPFAATRLRTDAAKRFKKVGNATAMVWKLLRVAEKRFRILKGYNLLPAVYAGQRCIDGVLEGEKTTQERIAA